MAINLISEGFGKVFYDLLENTKSEVNIISPFISYSTADKLSKWLVESACNIQCTIITRFNREEFISGANSIEGLERLKQAGVNIYALQHLHTKLYIFDKDSAIMGSANFTMKGFFKNHELGMSMQNETTFTMQCVDYFSGLLQQIKENGNWELDLENIEKEKQLVKKILSKRGKANTNEYNNYRWGAVLDKEENDQQSKPEYDFEEHFDIFDRATSESTSYLEESNTGIWIKFEGSSENRVPNNMVYMKRKESNYQYLNRTYYPRQPISVKKDDIIFFAVVSRDKQGNDTPIVVGYASAEGFNANNVVHKDDKKYQEWNDRYPYYVEYSNGRFLSLPVAEGITLLELCNALKHKVYPRTLLKEKTPITEILKRHHQKAHIQITEEAKKYLIDRLESKFKQYGFDK